MSFISAKARGLPWASNPSTFRCLRHRYGVGHPPAIGAKANMATSSGIKFSPSKMMKVVKYASIIATGAFAFAYLSDTRAMLYSHVLVPLSHKLLDPENAHKMAIFGLRLNLCPKERIEDAPELEIEVRYTPGLLRDPVLSKKHVTHET